MKPESKLSRLSLVFLLGLLAVAGIYCGQRMETEKPVRSIPMDENQESSKNLLQIDVEILTRPVRRSGPCMVDVRLTNKTAKPELVNKRLAVGYKTSQSRELYFEIYRKGTNEDVGRQNLLYDRSLASAEEYAWLEPEQSITTSFNLFEWYSLPAPGEYELVACYQADEELAPKPAGLLTGTYCSQRIPFVIMP